MKKTIFFSMLLFAFIACTSARKTSGNIASTQAANSTTLPDSIYRFTVSFISIGSGTDKVAKQQFAQFIQQYNEKNNVKIIAEIINWGREGETDHCFKLNELNAQQQLQFIADTKEMLKESVLVRYVENGVCRYK